MNNQWSYISGCISQKDWGVFVTRVPRIGNAPALCSAVLPALAGLLGCDICVPQVEHHADRHKQSIDHILTRFHRTWIEDIPVPLIQRRKAFHRNQPNRFDLSGYRNSAARMRAFSQFREIFSLEQSSWLVIAVGHALSIECLRTSEAVA